MPTPPLAPSTSTRSPGSISPIGEQHPVDGAVIRRNGCAPRQTKARIKGDHELGPEFGSARPCRPGLPHPSCLRWLTGRPGSGPRPSSPSPRPPPLRFRRDASAGNPRHWDRQSRHSLAQRKYRSSSARTPCTLINRSRGPTLDPEIAIDDILDTALLFDHRCLHHPPRCRPMPAASRCPQFALIQTFHQRCQCRACGRPVSVALWRPEAGRPLACGCARSDLAERAATGPPA